MRVGFVSGDLFELAPDRSGVSVPDYAVQGHLLRKLIERGHEVVLLTSLPKATASAQPISYEYAPEADPTVYGLDLLFVDRLGVAGSQYVTAMDQIQMWEGPIVYHSYIASPGWNPPFSKYPDELTYEKKWLILNRADFPKEAHAVMCGKDEQVPSGLVRDGVVSFRQWEPFFMAEHPWQGASADKPNGKRAYRQGYYGRLPQSERYRARKVSNYMADRGWSRVCFGPPASTRWLSEDTGCHNGGKIEHRNLPYHLTEFDFTIQVAIDRFRNKGRLGYRTHRLIECAQAGVLQLFDPEMGIPEMKPWEVKNLHVIRHWGMIGQQWLRDAVTEQQLLLLPRANPKKVMDELENHLLEWAGS